MILEGRTVSFNKFEWDEEKNIENKKKHKISFEVAVEIFNDDNTIIIPDDEHSFDEVRFVAIGVINDIVSVVFTERLGGDVLRIISAQKAKAEFRRIWNEYNNI